MSAADNKGVFWGTLGVIAEPADRDALAQIIFAETSSIGLRFHPVARLKLPREIVEVETRYGKIRVKISSPHGQHPITITPEYEDCRRLAAQHSLPLRVVIDEARTAARAQLK